MALPTSPQRPPVTTGRDLSPLPPVDPHDTEVEFAENFAGNGARRHVPAVGEHIRAWRPDVVVREETDFGSAMAAELAGRPVRDRRDPRRRHPRAARARVAGPPGRAGRARAGRPTRALATFRRDLVLSPFPPGVPRPGVAAAARRVLVPRRARSRRTRTAGSSTCTLGTVFNTGVG